jgi:molybdate transport system substrate-binding protein
MHPTKSFVLTCLLGISLITSQAWAEEVKIAVAANFTDVARELAPLFEQTTGHKTKTSFGSTGKLYAQIQHGAPYEIFLAADTQRPIKAETNGLAVDGSRFVYAKGKLVLWSAKADLFTNGEVFLQQGDIKRIALANPKTAPYGVAAEEVMQKAGALSRLRPKLVRGDSISQTFQFTATRNADAGFVAMAQLKVWKGESGSLWEIPGDYYKPIEQAAVLLKRGEENPAAIAYLEFLKSDAARQVIMNYGYGVTPSTHSGDKE